MISIIIPTYNRCFQLENTLKSLTRLKTDPMRFEIVIVDNASTDHTKQVSENFIQHFPGFNIRYFYETIPGLLSGRHRGAEEAKGEIYTFIDDDVEVNDNWLETILNVMEANSDVDLLTGPCLPQYEIDPPEWLSNFWIKDENGLHCGWLSLLDFGDKEKEIDPIFVWGLNFTVRKFVFERLKGFHPDITPEKFQMFQGDGETGLSLKAKEAGFKAWYHPQVKLKHLVPKSRLSIDYFKQRAYSQGISNSYTDIRKQNGLYSVTDLEHSNPEIRIFIKKIRRWVKKMYFDLIKKELNNVNNPIIDQMQQAEREGYQFHQQQFIDNQKVRAWVLQENYMNYQLP